MKAIRISTPRSLGEATASTQPGIATARRGQSERIARQGHVDVRRLGLLGHLRRGLAFDDQPGAVDGNGELRLRYAGQIGAKRYSARVLEHVHRWQYRRLVVRRAGV